MRKLIVATLILTLLVAGCSSDSKEGAPTTIEYKLAVINAGHYVEEHDATVAQFRNLLDSLSAKFTENQQQIADMSVTAQNILRDAGIEETLMNIMKGMDKLFSSP